MGDRLAESLHLRDGYVFRQAMPLNRCPARAELVKALAVLNHESCDINRRFRCGHAVHKFLRADESGSALKFCDEVLLCLSWAYVEATGDLCRQQICGIAEAVNSVSVKLPSLDLRDPFLLRATLDSVCFGQQKEGVCGHAPRDQRLAALITN